MKKIQTCGEDECKRRSLFYTGWSRKTSLMLISERQNAPKLLGCRQQTCLCKSPETEKNEYVPGTLRIMSLEFRNPGENGQRWGKAERQRPDSCRSLWAMVRNLTTKHNPKWVSEWEWCSLICMFKRPFSQLWGEWDWRKARVKLRSVEGALDKRW